MNGDQAGVVGHARCRYGMRRGHVDGWAEGKMIGQMYVAGFTSFEVHEPGGQDIGAGKRI